MKNTIVGGQKQEVPEEVLTNVHTRPVPDPVPKDVWSLYGNDEEDDEISDEELVQSYTMLYENLVDVVKTNETLRAQIVQLGKEKGALKKRRLS